MGFAHRAFVAVGVGFAVSAIVGCGSNGGRWLSASEANSLSVQLNRVTQALAEQRCSDARQYLAEFQASVNHLGGVNSTLISNLDQGASTIQSLASSQCQIRTVTTPKKTHTRTVTATTPTTTTTATQTTSTFTTPTQTYTQPTYTQPPYTQPNTTGGTCPTCGVTTSTGTGPTSPTTSQSGGTGLGGTGSSGGDTTTSSTTSTTSTTGVGGGY